MIKKMASDLLTHVGHDLLIGPFYRFDCGGVSNVTYGKPAETVCCRRPGCGSDNDDNEQGLLNMRDY
jgi:hypothetical protein